ncbi:hypothetical protein [Providencia sp. PROV174]|uniref:hypothetical protein n=1 Tax=Providencia sp. PROV174 TaxID=2949877 RepID=UPI00234B11E2|nr:hypothetical protein [Providencia sp. PROV174]
MRFSEYYGLKKNQQHLDFVDIPLDTDIPVFLDPSSIKSINSAWGNELTSCLQSFFDKVITLMSQGNQEGAIKLLSRLNESNEYHLGYSSGASKGKGFGKDSATSVWLALTRSKVISTGLLKDLEDTALLIPGIGIDMISDAVCNILRGPFIRYTQNMCEYYGVKLEKNIASGSIWDAHKQCWYDELVSLPKTSYGKVILVPKNLVRHQLSYDSDEYYRHYLLPAMQEEHLNSNSSLVQVLKSGERRVTKKSLIKEYGNNKDSVGKQTLSRKNILDEYKEDKQIGLKPLTLEEFHLMESNQNKLNDNFNEEIRKELNQLVSDMMALPTGASKASEYEDIIEKIFTIIFYPSLVYPSKQHKIHNDRKRIDITYTNESKEGFFYWLSAHYCCPFMFVECKNYSNEINNPELDQISGRFSPSRGKVGILVCRKIKNKKLFMARCIDTKNDDRGYIIPLDDEDVKKLAEDYLDTENNQDFPLLRKIFRDLVN